MKKFYDYLLKGDKLGNGSDDLIKVVSIVNVNKEFSVIQFITYDDLGNVEIVGEYFTSSYDHLNIDWCRYHYSEEVMNNRKNLIVEYMRNYMETTKTKIYR